MNLPFKRTYRQYGEYDPSLEKNLTGDEIRNRLITKGEEAGLLWRKERNIRGFNECPFDLVFGDKRTLEMCAIEIKGDTDDYSRLKIQLEEYLFGFGEVYLALHKKEYPEWLPTYIGILRIKEDGETIIERSNSWRNPLSVSTEFEWDMLFRANGLGVTHKRVRDILDIIWKIRQNVIFNRMFAIQDELDPKKFETFYPLTTAQKEIIIGFDLNYHIKQVRKDIKEVEERLKMIKSICNVAELTDKQLSLC